MVGIVASTIEKIIVFEIAIGLAAHGSFEIKTQ